MNWEENEVLRVLKKAGEPISIRDISKKAFFSKQKVYQILEKLRREDRVGRELRQAPQVQDFNVYFLKEEDGVLC